MKSTPSPSIIRRSRPPLVWRLGEIFFTTCAVITLPVWFPMLALWVVVDVPYHYTRWMAQKRIPEGQVKSVPGS